VRGRAKVDAESSGDCRCGSEDSEAAAVGDQQRTFMRPQLERTKVRIRRMWAGGPLRQFSTAKQRPHGGFERYTGPILNGWAGAYVCNECLSTSQGVYGPTPSGKWLCGGCRETSKGDKSLHNEDRERGASARDNAPTTKKRRGRGRNRGTRGESVICGERWPA
jgi:hypothetical protein